MTVIVILFRHAQAFHNSLWNSGMKNNALEVRDPLLTPEGHSQVLFFRFEDFFANHACAGCPS